MSDKFYQLMTDPDNEATKYATAKDDAGHTPEVDEADLQKAKEESNRKRMIFEQNEEAVTAHFSKELQNFVPISSDHEVLRGFEEFANAIESAYSDLNDDSQQISKDLANHIKFLLDYPVKNWKTYFEMAKENTFVSNYLQCCRGNDALKDTLAAIGSMVVTNSERGLPLDELNSNEDLLKLIYIFNKRKKMTEKASTGKNENVS